MQQNARASYAPVSRAPMQRSMRKLSNHTRRHLAAQEMERLVRVCRGDTTEHELVCFHGIQESKKFLYRWRYIIPTPEQLFEIFGSKDCGHAIALCLRVQRAKIGQSSRSRRRYAERNRHHLIPRSRGGIYAARNLLLINTKRHDAWHRVFGLMTLEEVIVSLSSAASARPRDHITLAT